MVRRKKAKTTALALTAIIFLANTAQHITPMDICQFGISKEALLLQRLVFHFFHASMPHAILNTWCLLSLAFLYHVSVYEIIMAWLIASSFPVDTLCNCIGDWIAPLPTIGLSGVLFSLMGQVAHRVQRKVYYHLFIGTSIAMGFLFPNANVWIHIYGYVVGFLIGFLNAPVHARK